MITLAEARTVSIQEKRWLKQLRQLVHESVPSATIILYGSAARGSRSAESDYDIVVLTPAPLTLEQRDALRARVYDFELAHGLVLAIAFYSYAEWNDLRQKGSLFCEIVEQEGIRVE